MTPWLDPMVVGGWAVAITTCAVAWWGIIRLGAWIAGAL